jgi:peroxiredoxin
MRVLAAILAVAVIGILIFLAVFQRVSHREERSTAGDEYFDKLRIERAEKRPPAPDFTLEDLSGKRVGLKQFRGKVVFLNFWATWCIPCREEMPAMEKLHRELRDEGLEVVAVNFKESNQQVRKFFGELGLTFIALLDKEGEVSKEYGVWSLPLSYFIDRRGEFVGKAMGSRNWDSEEARNFFLDLLKEDS